MKNKKWYQNAQIIFALSALTVSLVAVIVGVYSAYIDRAYARASVWPRLGVGYSNVTEFGGTPTFKYLVSNNGTGPAIIKHIQISYGGELVKNWSALFKKAKFEDADNGLSSLHGRVLSAGAEVTFLNIHNDEHAKTFYRKHTS